MQAALNNIESLRYFGPELVLVAAIILCLLWDLVAKERRIRLWGVLLVALASLAYSAGVSVQVLSGTITPVDLFGGTVVPPDAAGATGLTAFDQFSNLFRALFALVTAVTIVFIAPQRSRPSPVVAWGTSSPFSTSPWRAEPAPGSTRSFRPARPQSSLPPRSRCCRFFWS